MLSYQINQGLSDTTVYSIVVRDAIHDTIYIIGTEYRTIDSAERTAKQHAPTFAPSTSLFIQNTFTGKVMAHYIGTDYSGVHSGQSH